MQITLTWSRSVGIKVWKVVCLGPFNCKKLLDLGGWLSLPLAICVHDLKYKTQAGWQGSITSELGVGLVD